MTRFEDKYKNQLAELSEYNERYQEYPTEAYIKRSLFSAPKNISTSLYDINKTLNQNKHRFPKRQTDDLMNVICNNMFVNNKKSPSTYYYLGKIPTNGTLDIYSMKDFETLTNIAIKDLWNFNLNLKINFFLISF